jgi:hypothetical protein
MANAYTGTTWVLDTGAGVSWTGRIKTSGVTLVNQAGVAATVQLNDANGDVVARADVPSDDAIRFETDWIDGLGASTIPAGATIQVHIR